MEKETRKETKITHSLLILIAIYLLVNALALHIGFTFIPKIESGEIQPAVENPDKPETTGGIFLYILFITGVFLLLMKYKLGIFVRALMFIAMFMGLAITSWSLFSDYWFYFAVPFYAFFVWKRKNALVSNITLILTIAGIGGYLGASLSFIPALLLLLLLSIYDIVAVFGTKHMVTLAEGAKDTIPLFSVPVRDRFLGIGTGDLAIPSMFAVSVLHDFSLNHALITIVGGLLGLISLFFYILKKEKVTLPALPPITIGLFIGFVVGFLLL